MKYETLSDLLRSEQQPEELGISDKRVISPRMQSLEYARKRYEENQEVLARLVGKTFIG
jgi:hypothetical protein